MDTEPKKIVGIRVYSRWENCDRTTYYVELRTDEGLTKTPDGHRTGSERPKVEGISKEEARERALTDAYVWSDFLGIPVDPFIEDGVEYTPKLRMKPYSIRRALGERSCSK